MKKSRMVGILSIVLVVGLLVGCSSQQGQEEPVKVGIGQIVEHPALDAARKGFKEELSAQGYEEGTDISYDYQNAQGDMSTLQTIANDFAQDDLDLALAIATPTAQAIANNLSEKPIIFSAVTDPQAAGLVTDPGQPSGNLTGASDLTPIGQQFKLLKQIKPTTEKIGIIYNSGESNSVAIAKIAQERAAELGVELVTATVTSSSEVYQAAQSLVGRVDGIYIPTDNTVVSAMQSVVKVANQNNLPVVAADNNALEEGALATLGIDYYQLGRQTGKMAAQILEGKEISQVPVERIKESNLAVNLKVAEEIDLQLPAEVIEEAEKVIE